MEISSESKSDILPKALQALSFADEEQIAFLSAKLLKIIEKSNITNGNVLLFDNLLQKKKKIRENSYLPSAIQTRMQSNVSSNFVAFR